MGEISQKGTWKILQKTWHLNQVLNDNYEVRGIRNMCKDVEAAKTLTKRRASSDDSVAKIYS